MAKNNVQGFRELQSGTKLCNGKYTIGKKIGEGGFGITYKAVQSGLGRTVCIKEYFPAGECIRNTHAKSIHLLGMSSTAFEKYRRAFLKEAKTLAMLKHPNIVEVIDMFNENNTSYMVMTFIEGQNLQSFVEKQGKLSYPEAVNYIAQLANAVGYIHSKNIYHRDIKPENVIITPDKNAILIDFGSARNIDQIKYTAIQRSAHYAPIEQYNANSPKGNYTDIYSIGATFYFAVTGMEPLDATERLSENKKMPEPKELNPAIPNEANRTILKAMQIKPENRHQNIEEFMDDLLNIKPSILINETIGGITVIQKGRKWLWMLLIFLVISGGIFGFIIKSNKEKEKKIILQQEIITETKTVNDFIGSDTVYYRLNNLSYHLFRDCENLGMNPVRGSVQQAFENNVTKLCTTCVNRMTEFRHNCGEAIDFKRLADDLNDVKYYNMALDWCNKALQMRPDNTRMIELKQQMKKSK